MPNTPLNHPRANLLPLLCRLKSPRLARGCIDGVVGWCCAGLEQGLGTAVDEVAVGVGAADAAEGGAQAVLEGGAEVEGV